MNRKLLMLSISFAIIALVVLSSIAGAVSAAGKPAPTPPMEPVRYEYYTTVVTSHYFDAYDTQIVYWLGFSNGGDTEAEVTYTTYNTTNIEGDGINASSEMTEIENGIFTISGKHSKSHKCVELQNPSYDANSGDKLKFAMLTFKISSNSKFVAPRLLILSNSGNIIDEYAPGDFQKVEIYS